MKNDELHRLEIGNALKKALFSAASTIHIAANSGVITLFGWVDQFAKKTEAEKATRKIRGVKSVINFIDVVRITSEQKNDLEMEAKIRTLFKRNWNTRNNAIKVNVTMGWVTLSGILEGKHQKDAAMMIASNLKEVKGVANKISIKAVHDKKWRSLEVTKKELNHPAEIAITELKVILSNRKLHLSGRVDS